MSDTDTSLRDTIAEAIAETAPEAPVVSADPTLTAEADPTGATDAPEAPAAAQAKPATTTDKAGRDKSGRFAGKTAATTTDAPAAAKPTATPTPAAATETATPEAKAAVANDSRAPQSLSPAAREDWAKVPPSVQREFLRREKETTAALQETATARKEWESFKSVLQPHDGRLRARGADVSSTLAGMLQFDAVLHHGGPEEKAQSLAHLIVTSGVPLESLDKQLEARLKGSNGQAQQPNAAHLNPQAIAEQVRKQLLGEFEQKRQTALAQKHAADIAKFGETREFFEDVRQDMADIIEARARRGISLTPEAAYDLACSMSPEISAVLKQRQAATQANVQNTSTQRARAAASSVRSQPASLDTKTEPTDVRSALRASIRELSGS
jgi:hypothetical protein